MMVRNSSAKICLQMMEPIVKQLPVWWVHFWCRFVLSLDTHGFSTPPIVRPPLVT